MFCLITPAVFVPPCPLIPTAATFTRSLGACMPRPSTWRGTIMNAVPAPAAAAVVMNWRLDTAARSGVF